MDANFDYLHISIGSCKYGKYKKGDMVEISPEGYDASIHELHEECFGKVTEYKNGVLSVILVGEDKPKAKEKKPDNAKKETKPGSKAKKETK